MPLLGGKPHLTLHFIRVIAQARRGALNASAVSENMIGARSEGIVNPASGAVMDE